MQGLANEDSSMFVFLASKAVGAKRIPPSINEFLEVLAQLGGYNARKNDPPPGPQHIWIGVRRMTDFALAWSAFQEQTKVVCN
jgi:hypothetical protein